MGQKTLPAVISFLLLAIPSLSNTNKYSHTKQYWNIIQNERQQKQLVILLTFQFY